VVHRRKRIELKNLDPRQLREVVLAKAALPVLHLAPIIAASRATVGVATPWRCPATITGPSRGLVSVLRLRTARSRQMPLRVLAEWR